MENYFSKNMLDIVLPQSWWYLFIVTKKEIPENRSLFIWIDWKRMWAVSLTNKYSLDVRNTNEYLYDIEEMPLINIKVPTSLYKYGNPISMNFYVGEKWNWVSEIRVIPR
jgi:hypothetical protein